MIVRLQTHTHTYIYQEVLTSELYFQTKAKIIAVHEGYTHEVPKCASTGVANNVSSGLSRRFINGLYNVMSKAMCKGVSQDIPNDVSKGFSNGMSSSLSTTVCNGITRSGPHAMPLSLQKDMILRRRV